MIRSLPARTSRSLHFIVASRRPHRSAGVVWKPLRLTHYLTERLGLRMANTKTLYYFPNFGSNSQYMRSGLI